MGPFCHAQADVPEKLAVLSTPSSSQREKDRRSAGVDDSSQAPPPQYSQFTAFQKRSIVFIITFAAPFSPLSSFIFFPAINALSLNLHVPVQKINLTITSYMIISGIAPAVMGDLADMTGRRIVYLLAFGIYLVANIGLAVQTS